MISSGENSVIPAIPMPYFREAGSGTAVICLHSSASSSGQWRTLMERLSRQFRVMAVDLYGSGKTAAWPSDQAMYLSDEVELLSPMFEAAGHRFHLVGHSFGAAIAMKAALALRGRVLSLVLYEPVLFSALMADAPGSAAADDILSVRNDTIRLVDAGELMAAAQRFIEYWSGDGAWAEIPESRRSGLAAAMRAVKTEWHAAFHEPSPLSVFGEVDAPTLLLTGTKSKASTLAVARLLMAEMPRVIREEIDGVGHMAPVTHPDLVNPRIERFLECVPESRDVLDGSAYRRHAFIGVT